MQETKLGLGLAAIGRPDYINIRDHKEIDKSFDTFRHQATNLMDYAYQQGIRHFDTAPSYGRGEQFLMDWHKMHNYTDLLFSTKWGYTYVANWEIGYTGEHEIKEHSLPKLNEQWEASRTMLPALKTYQIHSATFESKVLENQPVLERLMELKKTHDLMIGLSSSGANQAEVLSFAQGIKIDGEDLFDSFQVTFNVLEQSCLSVLKDLLHKGKQVIIKEALANGRIFLQEGYYHGVQKVLMTMADKYQVGIDAIAIRFVIDILQPSILLSGASSIQQLKDNLRSLSFKLDKEEIAMLKNLAYGPHPYWADRKAMVWN